MFMLISMSVFICLGCTEQIAHYHVNMEVQIDQDLSGFIKSNWFLLQVQQQLPCVFAIGNVRVNVWNNCGSTNITVGFVTERAKPQNKWLKDQISLNGHQLSENPYLFKFGCTQCGGHWHTCGVHFHASHSRLRILTCTKYPLLLPLHCFSIILWVKLYKCHKGSLPEYAGSFFSHLWWSHRVFQLHGEWLS